MKHILFVIVLSAFTLHAMDDNTPADTDTLLKEWMHLLSPTLPPLEIDHQTLAIPPHPSYRIILKRLLPQKGPMDDERLPIVEKNKRCTTCAAQFKTLKELRNHFARNHQTEKPFECNQCDKAYSTQSSCGLHIKRVHGPKIFSCTHCAARVYAVRGDLTQHLKRKHPSLY